MANEITLSVSANGKKGNAEMRTPSFNVSVTMAGTNMANGVTQTVPTSATALNLASIAGAASMVIIKNLDSTNYIDIGAENTAAVDPDRIKPGGVIVRSPTAALYGKANTASVQIQIWAAE